METIRDTKIKVYADTNKMTYEKEFGNIDDAGEYLDSLAEESLRETKITVSVDTNKTTYEKEFGDFDDAKAYLESLTGHIQGMQSGVQPMMVEEIGGSTQNARMPNIQHRAHRAQLPSASALLE